MRYLVVFLATYFLAGIISANVNSWLVKERKSIVEKFHKLRLHAFKNDLGVQIEFSPDIYEIGFDEDKARSVVNSSELKKFMSDEGFAKLVAVAICLTGFLTYHRIWSDYASLSKLKESYQQAEYVVRELMDDIEA